MTKFNPRKKKNFRESSGYFKKSTKSMNESAKSSEVTELKSRFSGPTIKK